MNQSAAEFDRLWTLLEAVAEERASAADVAELQRQVLASPEARWIYLSYVELHGTLYWDAAGGLGVDAASALELEGLAEVVAAQAAAAPAQSVGSRRKQLAAAVSLAACLLVAVAAWSAFVRPPAGIPVAGPDAVDRATGPLVPPESHGDAGVGRHREPVQLGHSDAPSTMQPVDAPSTVREEPAPVVDGSPNSPPAVARVEGAASGDSVTRVAAQVDALLRSGWERWQVAPSPPAEDGEWLRRVYLDLAGRIPTVPEVDAFVADSRADKRRRVVDDLLDGGEYARNFTAIWSRLLVGRAPNTRVSRPALDKYLRMSFAANRPWNQMVEDLVAAEGRTTDNGAANFLVAHLNNQAVPATAITARLFLGVQVQCAQCHNHPFNDTKQVAFWELNSLFQQTAAVERYHRDGKSAQQRYAYTELVSRDEGGPIYYETLGGLMKVAFPRYYGHDVDPGPQINRRKELARMMTTETSSQFAAAFVNRLWAHFIGAGFTNPVDDMGPHNPPSHPEVLQALADEFVRSGYDVKQLIRWICATEVYRLSSRATPENRQDDPSAGEPPAFSHVYVKPMSPEQLYDSLVTATRAHQSGVSDWAQAEEQRQAWLDQFVVSLQNDENDEADTLAGTYSQALTVMNGELVARALELSPGTFLGELVREKGSETDKIRRLCEAALSRPPTAKELSAMQKVVREGNAARPRNGARPGPSAAGYQDLFWALLNSNEFALVH